MGGWGLAKLPGGGRVGTGQLQGQAMNFCGRLSMGALHVASGCRGNLREGCFDSGHPGGPAAQVWGGL